MTIPQNVKKLIKAVLFYLYCHLADKIRKEHNFKNIMESCSAFIYITCRFLKISIRFQSMQSSAYSYQFWGCNNYSCDTLYSYWNLIFSSFVGGLLFNAVTLLRWNVVVCLVNDGDGVYPQCIRGGPDGGLHRLCLRNSNNHPIYVDAKLSHQQRGKGNVILQKYRFKFFHWLGTHVDSITSMLKLILTLAFPFSVSIIVEHI